MKKTHTEQIGNLLRRYLREEGIETPLNQHRLINAWADVMGHVIMNYTGERFIKGQTLFVQINSSVLKQELMMSRATIVRRLNEHVQAQVITDIQFY